MKKLIIGIFTTCILSSTVFASQVRKRTAVCTSKYPKIAFSFFSHSDVIRSGLVDLLVQYNLPIIGKETYLINDIVGSAIDKNKTKFFFTDGDITIDIVIDNDANLASFQVSEEKRITLKCVEK